MLRNLSLFKQCVITSVLNLQSLHERYISVGKKHIIYNKAFETI
jgi:hypothetical protein